MNILIVEDEAIIAESIYQLLSLLSYHPYEPVDKPEDAIALIRDVPPDLAILDLSLSHGRSGLEVAAYLREHHPSIPYIILTAHSDAETIAKVKQYRPAAYLIKPFVRESLFAAIEIAAPPEEDEENEETKLPVMGDRFIKFGNTHEKLDFRQLKYLKAQGKYTELHFPFGKRLIRTSLSTFTVQYPLIKWIRVHKSYAVNSEHITRITSDEVFLEKDRIPIGRFFQPKVHQLLTA